MYKRRDLVNDSKCKLEMEGIPEEPQDLHEKKNP